jgi:hypothetical protein
MAMATTAGNALAGAGVAAMQLAPAQPAFTLDPDFPVFDGGAGGVAGVGPLPPLPPLYQVDAAVVSGKADNACFAVEVAVDRMHAAVWDKRTSKAVAVNLDPREPAMVRPAVCSPWKASRRWRDQTSVPRTFHATDRDATAHVHPSSVQRLTALRCPWVVPTGIIDRRA